MKRFLVIPALGFALAGCASATFPSLNINTSVTRNTLYSVEGSYGIALSGERAYKALPLCKTGTTINFTNLCAKRSTIVKLQSADRVALSAIKNANAYIKAYPTLDATNVISAAQSAVSSLQQVVASAQAGN
jgi:hypothetical protein